jgi:hypothetical protein
MWQQWRRSGKRKDSMKLSLPPKLVEKSHFIITSLVIIFFCDTNEL